MTIYVDDSRIRARVGHISGRWSHLFTDTDHAELHTFAKQIGLRREWFQDRSGHAFDYSHYDVTENIRQRAIQAGARPITVLDSLTILSRGRHAYR